MNKQEIQALVEQYADQEDFNTSHYEWPSQYDDRSAKINYSLIRHFKPKIVVEFGTHRGRCTYDMIKALDKNGEEYIFKPYEINDGLRQISEDKVYEKLRRKIKIGSDIVKARDVPDNIDYLFIDNNHDILTTEWVFSTLIKKCKPGALIQIHDLPFYDDFQLGKGGLPETAIILEMQKNGTLPLEKFYWTWEEGDRWESTWWRYKPL